MSWLSALAWTLIGLSIIMLVWQWRISRLTNQLIAAHQLLLADNATMHAALVRIAAAAGEDCGEAARVAERALRVVAKL